RRRGAARGVCRDGRTRYSAGRIARAGAAGRVAGRGAVMPEAGDLRADVVIVGFGAAGACAALEARAAGADVLVLDRFSGGGATALSGGVVYAGGGTPQQRQAGVTDSVDAMVSYLGMEVGDAVSAATVREFCAGSAAMIDWLAGHGGPVDGTLCPEKTSSPTHRHYPYSAGSEASSPQVAEPAPRGHRAVGKGTSGKLLYARLAAAARSAGVRVVPQTRAARLVTSDDGRVTGVECRSLLAAPAWARAGHRVLSLLGRKPYLYAGGLGRRVYPPGTS